MALDIEIDERVGLLSGSGDALANCRIAEHGDGNLIELDIAAARRAKIGDLGAIDGGEVGEEMARVGIDGGVAEVGAAVEMHGRGRRHGDLRGRRGNALQERELVGSQGLQARELAGGVGRREIRLVAVVVAKLEGRRPDCKALTALDEPAPVGAAAELPIGDDRQARLLLQSHRLADCRILGGLEGGRRHLAGGLATEGLAQGPWPQQAADMIGAEGRM